MDNEKVINQLLPAALIVFKKYGLLPSVTIAQDILETGWLNNKITSKNLRAYIRRYTK